MPIVVVVYSAGYRKKVLLGSRQKEGPEWLAFPGVTKIASSVLETLGIAFSARPVGLTEESVFRLRSAAAVVGRNHDAARLFLVGDDAVVAMMAKWWKENGPDKKVEVTPVDGCVGFGGFAEGVRAHLSEKGLDDRDTTVLVPHDFLCGPEGRKGIPPDDRPGFGRDRRVRSAGFGLATVGRRIPLQPPDRMGQSFPFGAFSCFLATDGARRSGSSSGPFPPLTGSCSKRPFPQPRRRPPFSPSLAHFLVFAIIPFVSFNNRIHSGVAQW
jgi:hypothetical protein